jgi:hypothetical protein
MNSEQEMPDNPDLQTLTNLNADYIRSVQNSDVARFDQILADDFLCSNPDGSLVERAAFLEQVALPAESRPRIAAFHCWILAAALRSLTKHWAELSPLLQGAGIAVAPRWTDPHQ